MPASCAAPSWCTMEPNQQAHPSPQLRPRWVKGLTCTRSDTDKASDDPLNCTNHRAFLVYYDVH
ncbi:hypothetical protein SDJN02_03786, partial [Cucurbita argyrosperma subsp. argyrosperma]